MSLMMTRRRRATNKGFNLIEAAIVLGIVGLVVGGIWVAATSVYANLRSKRGTDELLQVAQSVRALYATSSTTGYAANTDITAFMAQSNVLPSDVLSGAASAATGGNTSNPWNGNVFVMALANGTTFQIAFTNVPPAACVDFVMRNAGGTGRDTGLTQIAGAADTTGTAPQAVVATNTQALTIGTTLTLTQAQTVCASTANLVRNVAFTFNLRS